MSLYIGINRILGEYKDLQKNPIPNIGISVALPNENNYYEWRITSFGADRYSL